MRKFGLIGYPLGHSFSKKYFTDKFSGENIAGCSYELFPLADINQFTALLEQETSLCGLNVTIPYKTQVMSFLDLVSEEALAVGAVNVIKIKRQPGRLHLSGYNTDTAGFLDSLLPYLGNKRGNAIVLGTGGSSKAVCYVLKKLGMKITLVSRHRLQGVITYNDLNRDLLKSSTLIVNATPVGMFPQIESKPPINYNSLHDGQILFDLVYNPEMTGFLSEGQKRGCTVISGLKMLYIQAEKSWEIWNNDDLQ